MTDRITKWLKNHLVNCEYTEFGWQECHRYEFDEDELEEFTELIVQECCNLVESNMDPHNAWITPAYIKEHFGIKS